MILIVYSKQKLNEWKKTYPIFNDIMNLSPVVWLNPNLKNMKHVTDFPITRADIDEAETLWHRFAPFFAQEFPETRVANGIIESELRQINKIKEVLYPSMTGALYLKCDHNLPIAGSIKARGGIYEVLQYAEGLAIEADMLTKNDNYDCFSTDRFKAFFRQFSIGVGSTGNLGLSIGIISAKLGFNVSVYMSRDAKQWKKDLLREKGAAVLEFDGDFSEAIRSGREKTLNDPKGYFVDDEDSPHLFVGYSTAAIRLEKQLKEQDIKVDEDHPLFVYLPCGVGGSPGGITFGLKQIFGNNVHCFFVEPTHSPSVLLGLLTGEMDHISVQDAGIDNRTEADGLAVGRPSQFATTISSELVEGIYTLEDNDLYRLLYLSANHEGIYLEPSAAAGLAGPERVINAIGQDNLPTDNITHIVWATGGALVPEQEMNNFYAKGKSLS